MSIHGKKLNELPSFLSMVSMIFDDQELTIEKLFDAERKSPPFYKPAREFFCSVLREFSTSQAVEQAAKLSDPTERSCAIDVLAVANDFLTEQAKSRVTKIDLNTVAPNGLKLRVAPLWVRELDKPRILVLHLWRTPLTEYQQSAAAALLRHAIQDHATELGSYELDFVSTSYNSTGLRREFRCLDWKRIRPLDDGGLARFWNRFIKAWDTYQKRPPKPHSKKPKPGSLL
jgi:hypothetical protein